MLKRFLSVAMALPVAAIASFAMAQSYGGQAGKNPSGQQMGTGPLPQKVTKGDDRGIEQSFTAINRATEQGNYDQALGYFAYPVHIHTTTQSGELVRAPVEREQMRALLQRIGGVPEMKSGISFRRTHTAWLGNELATVIGEVHPGKGARPAQARKDASWTFSATFYKPAPGHTGMQGESGAPGSGTGSRSGTQGSPQGGAQGGTVPAGSWQIAEMTQPLWGDLLREVGVQMTAR